MQLSTWGLVVPNIVIWYKVMHVLACSAQLLQMSQSYACLGLWSKTPKNGT